MDNGGTHDDRPGPPGGTTSKADRGPHRQAHGTYVGSLAFSPNGTVLASGQRDTTVLLWDVGFLGVRRAASALTEEQMRTLWEQLADKDVRKAHSAMRTLCEAGEPAVRLLQDRLPPVPHTEAKRIQQLIAELDSPRFNARETAYQTLAGLGMEAEAHLKEVLRGKVSPESRKRIEALLAGPPPRPALTPELLRRLRAIQVLEHVEGGEAKALLRRLADGASGAIETQEAQLALQRSQWTGNRSQGTGDGGTGRLIPDS